MVSKVIKNMEITAKAKYLRMAPRKVRLVAGLIRGLSVEKAKWQLTFNKKLASVSLLKILESAIANAKETYDISADNLKIKSITVDGGPALKRWMPRAHGRATPLRKETSHIKLVLTEIIESGKSKKTKTLDDSDLVKVGVGDFDEIKETAEKKETLKAENKKASAKGFANKVLTRKTGSK